MTTAAAVAEGNLGHNTLHERTTPFMGKNTAPQGSERKHPRKKAFLPLPIPKTMARKKGKLGQARP